MKGLRFESVFRVVLHRFTRQKWGVSPRDVEKMDQTSRDFDDL